MEVRQEAERGAGKWSRLVLGWVLMGHLVQVCQGGSCWASKERVTGQCQIDSHFKKAVSREECCRTNPESFTEPVLFYWSEEDYPEDAGMVFRRLLGGGFKCSSCNETCAGITCRDNYKCKMRNGQPKCVCAPNCAAFRKIQGKYHKKGPVCGSDGRTYRSTCRLLKRSCRKNVDITIEYYGECKEKCSDVPCPEGKSCMLDQNGEPRCGDCKQTVDKCRALLFRSTFLSSSVASTSRKVCGADGRTYENPCEVQRAACQLGKAIPIAYWSPCTKKATCSTITCPGGRSCLVEPDTGRPRCVTCTDYKHCEFRKNNTGMKPLCGNDGKTYRTWCEMMRISCSSGVVIETRHNGPCSNTLKHG